MTAIVTIWSLQRQRGGGDVSEVVEWIAVGAAFECGVGAGECGVGIHGSADAEVE